MGKLLLFALLIVCSHITHSQHIRIATIADIDALAQIHYDSWHATYDHILDEKYIQKNTQEYLKKYWYKFFEKQKHDNRFLLVATSDNKIIGLISAGPIKIDNHEPNTISDLFEECTYDSEIYKFYILLSEQKKGLGKILLHEVCNQLATNGFKRIIVRVFTQNQYACSFYEHCGGKLLHSMPKNIEHGVAIPYEIYGLNFL